MFIANHRPLFTIANFREFHSLSSETVRERTISWDSRKIHESWHVCRVCSLQHTMLYPGTGFKSVVNNAFSGKCWVCDLYQQYSHVYTPTGYLNFAARLWILLSESSNQKQSHRYITRWNCNTWTEYTCINATHVTLNESDASESTTWLCFKSP